MAGIAVIRVSGPQAFAAVGSLTGALPGPRLRHARIFRHPQTEDVLDDGLLLLFPAPDSFTGEDVAEFHLHGSLAVIRAVLEALGGIAGSEAGRSRASSPSGRFAIGGSIWWRRKALAI